jgi:hypothetical protein
MATMSSVGSRSRTKLCLFRLSIYGCPRKRTAPDRMGIQTVGIIIPYRVAGCKLKYEDIRQRSPHEMVGLRRRRYPCNDSAVVANQAIAFTKRFSLFVG